MLATAPTVDPLPLSAQAEAYARLHARAAPLPNTDLFARMLASHSAGVGALPPGLGLPRDAFATLLMRHFPRQPQAWAPRDHLLGPEVDPLQHLPATGTMVNDRLAEWTDVLALLLEHRAGADWSEPWMAEIVATACMGGNHLWEDLGLWCRAELTRLMAENFPTLAALNAHDMKWKKFIYRQLCQREGLHVCPAPSCQVCVDYHACFGPET